MSNCTSCAELETWIPVEGHTDYEVSDHGRVRSLKRKHPLILKLQANPHRGGYLHFGPSEGRENQTTVKVHVAVAHAFIGPRPEGLDIRHLDGDPTNAHVTNLAYGTKLENEADKWRHGTRMMYQYDHCRHGHAYDEANTRWSNGMRFCRQCVRDTYQKFREKNVQRARDARARKKARLGATA